MPDINTEIGNNAQLKRRIRELEAEIKSLQQPASILNGLMKHENIALAVLQGAPPCVVLVNRGLELMSGYTSDELTSFSEKEQRAFVREEFYDTLTDRYYHRIEGSTLDSNYEFSIVRKDGEALDVRAFTYAIDYEGKPAVVISLVDITGMRFTEKALRESRERYRLLFEHTPVGIFYYDKDMIIREFNPRFCEIIRSPSDKLLGLDLSKVKDHSIKPCIEESLAGRSGLYEGPYTTTTSGIKIAVFMKTGPVFDACGNVTGGTGILEDITKRYDAEEALKKSEEKFKDIIDKSPLPIAMLDRNDRIVYSNHSCVELFGFDHKDIRDLTSLAMTCFPDAAYRRKIIKEWYSGYHDALATNSRFGPKEYRIICRNGTERDIEFNMVPIGDMYFIIMNDMTGHRRAEAEILKTRKIESLGILAGGIAHDFNNILTSIMGNISLAKLDADKDEKLYNTLEMIEKATLRARGLTRQLLTFSKGGSPVKRVTSIKNLLLETAGFVLAGTAIRVEFDIDDNLLDADIDEGQICQVIHNIVLNARQAMNDSGLIRIRADNFTPRGAGFTLSDDNYIRIVIKDTGPGIPAKIIPDIFDPFFTTKESGSGLGLSVSYSIVKKHGGEIIVHSDAGEGAVFEIYLPSTEERAPQSADVSVPAAETAARILVMDDDQLILDLCGRMLRRMGYEAVTSDNAAETIRLYKEAYAGGNPFSCVIMDLTVPGDLGGQEVNAILRECYPGIRSIVSSGYSDNPVMSNFREYGFAGISLKPYTYNELAAVIREVLESD